ncbi:MAG: hypothetical protein ACFFDN_40020 [Candidatus Hodarchaeota archaeon]
MQIAITSKDSTETNFRVTGGLGQYAHISRGCAGNVLEKEKIPFNEIGVSIDHKTKSPFRLGLNSSYIFTRQPGELVDAYHPVHGYSRRWSHDNPPIGIFTVNPFINAEWKYFAIGGGYFGSTRELDVPYEEKFFHFFSGYIRIGNIRKFYVDGYLFHTTHIYSNNFIGLGLGFRLNPNVGWWFGGGFGQYDKGGFLMKTDIRIRSNLYLDTLIRLGESEGISENAIGLGLTYKLIGGK